MFRQGTCTRWYSVNAFLITFSSFELTFQWLQQQQQRLRKKTKLRNLRLVAHDNKAFQCWFIFLEVALLWGFVFMPHASSFIFFAFICIECD